MFEYYFFKFDDAKELVVVYNAINSNQYIFSWNIVSKLTNWIMNYFMSKLDV